MEYKNNKVLLAALVQFIREKMHGQQVESLILFAQHYFNEDVFDDIADRTLDDLYGAVLSHWNLFLAVPADKEQVNIYNPSVEEHGWQSTHTVIEMVLPDRPFILQSITMEINRYGLINQLVLHPLYWVSRDEQGKLLSISETEQDGARLESALHIEINRQSNVELLAQLKSSLQRVLRDVRVATDDWPLCLTQVQSEIDVLSAQNSPELQEPIEFLQWLQNSHFIFLAYREYRLIKQGEDIGFRVVPGTGLGILRDNIALIPEQNFMPISPDAYQLLNTAQPLLITKATSKATVDRPVFMDYIGIKQYDDAGLVIGEKRFLGLYASSAYSCELHSIPMVRSKIKAITERFEQGSSTHSIRSLLYVLNSLPRDELFQASAEALYGCVIGVLQLQERQRVRVFVRNEVYGHFISLLVFVPRERYNTQSREKIQEILLDVFKGSDTDFSVKLTESILARVHFIIHSKECFHIQYDVKDIEQRIIAALSNWHDELAAELHFAYGEAEANEYLQAYCDGFSEAYKESISARNALLDLQRFEKMAHAELSVLGVLYSPLTATEQKQLYFKLYCFGELASLSRSLPMLENMGVKVCSEHPYEIAKKGQDKRFWIHDFGLSYAHVAELDLESVKPRFQEAFEQCWAGRMENDGFNTLILNADLNWREVNIFRALYFYLRQLGITFSQSYVEQTLTHNANVVQLLVQLFTARFKYSPSTTDTEALLADIASLIEQVKSLDEDRILRRYLNLILAAERTNFFNHTVDELDIPYFSIKFNSAKIDEIPSPIPYFEIFVYSPRMEGIHLRGGAVARGGLRWSDRREDFRTEVLGLMKAQMTKNAVIVPTGSKGGFVVKTACVKTALFAEGVACYRIFIRGLLDLTDNYSGNQVIKPKQVICYDGDDPYLVVAADKGTASFSDYANELSQSYQFWLNDAFASGGSAGYDHKEMGITARGAFVSVQHHFDSLGVDIQHNAFTVVGIGDMAGDVFGNGMLLSKNIKLLAAFNHESIFLDPNPNIDISFQERQRLFHLEKSGWSDYDKSLISVGGGVYSRQDKVIVLSDAIREVLAIETQKLSPNELIKAILMAPVDLLWNGGIGTYVKAHSESNSDVGDRANDAVRINGEQLRCKVVGEGGNLGFTQKGRIEYALNKGCINTDSIDNSGGVDCSDHEVNIKILLNGLLLQGDMTAKQRDILLESMTDQVAELVLLNNYQQNHAITMIQNESVQQLPALKRLMTTLETNAHLNCALEKLPNDKEMQTRKISGKGMTRPEISVLLAYTKQLLKAELLAESERINLALYQHELSAYFPEPLQKAYATEIQAHRLDKEIVANQLINSLVNRLGIVFPHRFMEELSCSASALVNIYSWVCRIFEIDLIWKMQSELDGVVSKPILDDIKLRLRQLIERAMYWCVRNEPQGEVDDHYVHSIAELADNLNQLVTDKEQKYIDNTVNNLIKAGVNAVLALKVAQIDILFSCLNAVKVHKKSHNSLQEVTKSLFYLDEILNLDWLRSQIVLLPQETTWQALSRRAMIDEYHQVCCVLLYSVLAEEGNSIPLKLDTWRKKNTVAFERYIAMINSAEADANVQLEKIVVILGTSWNLTVYGK
ncbi:MAG: NAD-glutamate dehydrogenase [Methyloprofundus sp.]|nr:NAD-glutamate dehydrogenase [Methyloprofundus sp.]MDT8424705.1 NAD-glutamate dehydrogenase [Methyloprofundus sp.]